MPLIFVIDDVQLSDKYSIDFFRYLFNNEEKTNNPFIIILIEQIPFNINYRPMLHRELEYLLTAFSESDDEADNISADKIITFDIHPIMEKAKIKQIIIENFKNSVKSEYPSNTRIEEIDDKILDFLLSKTFQGIPLLIIELFDSLFQTKKFITMNDNKFQITQELIDDNDTFDWSNVLIPYVYEKITSMAINSLLTFKEILLLKYGCTIGTFFDIQTLNKINPLNIIIKKEDLNNIMEKLNNEYIIEFFENEGINRKTRKNLVCKICFPFMREALHKKFPIERRASLHAETAKILSAGKKGYFFKSEIEAKILRRHLIYSEIDVVQVIESRNYPDNIINLYKNTKIMNTNNLTVLCVRDICSKIFDKNHKNVIEGNLEMKYGLKWILVNYYVDRQWKIYFKNIKKNPNEKDLEYIIPIKDIFKNTILENNILVITIIEYSFYLLNQYKTNLTFRSDNWKDILQLNTALSFLKMIAIYEKYIYNFGYTKFPLYKTGWYDKKEKKYYANFNIDYDTDQIVYLNGFKPYRKKRYLSYAGLTNHTDKLISQSKDINRPFNVIMSTAFTLLIANIQANITKFKININQEENDGRLIQGKIIYLMYIPTPAHVKPQIQEYLEEAEKKQKEEEEKLRSKFKAKYSLFPLSLIRQERRMFGSGIFAERKNQSISHGKTSTFEDNQNDDENCKDMSDIQEENTERSYFSGRKSGKSKTIIERIDIIKEIEDKIKPDQATTVELVDSNDSDSNNDNKHFSSSQSSSSSCGSDSASSSSDSEDKKEQLNEDINNIKIEDSKKDNENNKINEDNKVKENKEKIENKENNNKNKNNKKINNSNKIDKNIGNKIDNKGDDKIVNKSDNKIDNDDIINDYKNKRNSNNIINSKDIREKYEKRKILNNNNINNNNINNNINNNGNKKNKNENNGYSIKTFINNNININLINDGSYNSTKQHLSFLGDGILNNNLNININSLRMSYQRKEKPKQKTFIKKSNSAKVKTLKEKYRNSLNNYMTSISTNKMSIDDEEECTISSEKESENTDLYLTPKVLKKKKSSKLPEDITPTKEDIFSKAMISFLNDEKNINSENTFNKHNSTINYQNIRKQLSMNNSNTIINNKIKEEKIAEGNKPKKPVKRSSLCPRIHKFSDKKRHVTFFQRKSDKEPFKKSYSGVCEEMPSHKKDIDTNIKKTAFNKDK